MSELRQHLALAHPEATTTGPDLLLVAFQALSETEQEEAFARITEARLVRQAGDEGMTARCIRSIDLVAELVGRAPSADEYREARETLLIEGAEVESLSRLIRHFGSWHRAKEALALSETTTARRIEARFRSRRVGKVWRYSEQALEEALRRCVADIGQVPQVAQFDWWRQRELEKAAAAATELHLPSATPYRRRWKTWEAALLHFGFTSDEVAERLERQR